MKKLIKIKIYKETELVTTISFSVKYKIFKFMFMNNKFRDYGTLGICRFKYNDITFRSIQLPEMDFSNLRIFLPGYDNRFDNLNIYPTLKTKDIEFLTSFFKNNKKIYF